MPHFVPSNPHGAPQIRFLKGICSRAAVPRGLQLPSRVGGDLLCSGKRGRIASQPLLVLLKIISNSFPATAGGLRQGQLLRQGWCRDVALQGWILQSNPSRQRGQKKHQGAPGAVQEKPTPPQGAGRKPGAGSRLSKAMRSPCAPFYRRMGCGDPKFVPLFLLAVPGSVSSSLLQLHVLLCTALLRLSPTDGGVHRAHHTPGEFFNLPIITHPS